MYIDPSNSERFAREIRAIRLGFRLFYIGRPPWITKSTSIEISPSFVKVCSQSTTKAVKSLKCVFFHPSESILRLLGIFSENGTVPVWKPWPHNPSKLPHKLTQRSSTKQHAGAIAYLFLIRLLVMLWSTNHRSAAVPNFWPKVGNYGYVTPWFSQSITEYTSTHAPTRNLELCIG